MYNIVNAKPSWVWVCRWRQYICAVFNHTARQCHHHRPTSHSSFSQQGTSQENSFLAIQMWVDCVALFEMELRLSSETDLTKSVAYLCNVSAPVLDALVDSTFHVSIHPSSSDSQLHKISSHQSFWSIHPSIHPPNPPSPPAASEELFNSQQKKTGQLPSVSLSVKWCFAETEYVRSDDFLQVHKSLKRMLSLDSFSL